MQQAIHQLLEQPSIWRANDALKRLEHRQGTHIPTGFSTLDTILPGSGFPNAALTEILHEHHGVGELRLAMPALARLSRGGRWIALIAPPFIPYPPALAACGLDLSRVLVVHPDNHHQALWSVEQALRAGTCAAVLAWPKRCDDRSLRRLQLAAESGNSLGMLFREAKAAEQSSPAALRLRLDQAQNQRLDVGILKCRGAPTQAIELDTELTTPMHTQQPLPLEQ
jgi:cell division inhibitor SulA/protein ImuA